MSCVNGRPWTTTEDDAIRTGYGKLGARKVAAAIDRTTCSVMHRARRLGIQSHRRWTADDDRRLRTLWGEWSVAAIARRLGRTGVTTYWRAQQLGLPSGCPPGMEYVSAAAERTGFDAGQLRKIFRWAGVGLRPAMSRPSGSRRTFHVVDPFDVDEAVTAWLATETLETAARSRGFVTETLERLLWRFGRDVPPRPGKPNAHWRIPTATIDAAVAAYRATETVAEAARRHRMRPHRMSRWLRCVGAERLPGKPWRVRPEEADRAARAAHERTAV